MGLDMYLYKKTYVRNWDHMSEEEKHKITVTKNNKPTDIKPERIREISEEVGYWRKANAIHAWFVRNVQNGDDDCGEYLVTREKLTALLDDVNAVLNDRLRAPELLPPQEGFFFGSTKYDEYYFKDLEDTRKMIQDVLAEPEVGDFYYQSSW